MGRGVDFDWMRDKNLSRDLTLKRALEAIGYTDGRPLFRARHPVFNAATSHDSRLSVFVPTTTKTLELSIANWENPLFRDVGTT